MRGLIKIFVILSILVIPMLADFNDYQQNISELRGLLQKKELLRSELTSINHELSTLPENNLNWFEKRQLSNLNKEKSDINEQILKIYQDIAALKEVCYHDFHKIFRKNEQEINPILDQLEADKSNQRDSLLTQLLKLKEQRDFLIFSQKYIVDINKELLEPDFDHRILTNINPGVKKDFIELIRNKITNINSAVQAAEKEKTMQQKLNDFRNEIATIQEPENVTLQNPALSSEKSYTDEASYDNDMINFENSRAGGALTLNNYELVTSGSDFLILLEDKDPDYINNFITEMDSLKQYYERLLQNINE